MKKIRYKVVHCVLNPTPEHQFESVFALPQDSLVYNIGKVTKTKPIPASQGYYIAVFNELPNADTFITINPPEIGQLAILKVEVYGRHKIKKLPQRRLTFSTFMTSFFNGAKDYSLASWPYGTELWEKVRPIGIINTI